MPSRRWRPRYAWASPFARSPPASASDGNLPAPWTRCPRRDGAGQATRGVGWRRQPRRAARRRGGEAADECEAGGGASGSLPARVGEPAAAARPGLSCDRSHLRADGVEPDGPGGAPSTAPRAGVSAGSSVGGVLVCHTRPCRPEQTSEEDNLRANTQLRQRLHGLRPPPSHVLRWYVGNGACPRAPKPAPRLRAGGGQSPACEARKPSAAPAAATR